MIYVAMVTDTLSYIGLQRALQDVGAKDLTKLRLHVHACNLLMLVCWICISTCIIKVQFLTAEL